MVKDVSVKRYELDRLVYDRDAISVTRNGKGPGRVTYNGKFAGQVKVGKGGSLEFQPVRWVSMWEQARFVRERAIHLYKQELRRSKHPLRTRRVNTRRQRNRSGKAKSIRDATSKPLNTCCLPVFFCGVSR